MVRNFETDEDEMIFHLELHRDVITWLCNKLEKNGIKYKRTRGNSSKGDILLINKNDTSRVQEMIRNYHKEFNGK
ncbi:MULTISPECIES: hypothetical protein [unclassified Acinetobacter]|uniref:hypothetical protein n=1 Tax=unclassified Acinetobacter TaxID=196816 RepID=UPI0015D393CF|nr:MULTISPECIES: hypothetical protein [unclassified Acinetobacter]UNW06316.1 hypothetical protein MOV98_12000 [Acinetobacter variabilis]